MREGLLLLVVAFPLLGQQPVRDWRPPAATGTAEIRGRVLAEDTGLPLGGALVSLAAARFIVGVARSGLVSPSTVEADRDGSFVFPALPAGDYFLTASDADTRSRYLRRGYGAQGPDGGASVVTVAEGQRLRNVDIYLQPAAVIAGRVTDEFGEPLARVRVSALGWTGSRPLRAGALAMTDDLGQYRLFGLTPGTYLVAGESPTVLRENRASGLLLTYSPSALDPAQAKPLQLAGGQVAEADIRMARLPLPARRDLRILDRQE